jgi:hypothetical protein
MRPIKPDPYDGFKSDRERRRALDTRERCKAIAAVAIAVTVGVLRWLMH